MERGVQYFVTETAGFEGKRIVIVGGGDSAFDWSLALGEKAKQCIQIHRSDRFKAHEDSIAEGDGIP